MAADRDRIESERGIVDQAPQQPAATAEDQLFADNVPVMIWRSDTTKACDFFNKPWLDFTGRSMEEELGTGWLARVHPDDRERCLRTYSEAFDARRPFSMDYRLLRHDGVWRWVLDNGRPYEVDGRFAGYFGSCTDITEMKEALERQERAEREREALLSELRHRVKNNAQATVSFLALQARRSPDPVVAAALRSAATRVMLASQVQDRKFHGDAREGVELGRELEITAQAAMETLGRPGITLEVETIPEGLIVPVAQATPVALIVCELMVNALRHAFPGETPGHVRLSLRRLPGGMAEIRVADDGIGFPEEARRQVPRHCLGLHLAQRLARQLRGTLRLEGPPGTTAMLTFRPA